MVKTDFVGPHYYADPYYSSAAYKEKLAAAQEQERHRQALARGEATEDTLTYARFLSAVENDATHSRGGFKGFRHNDGDIARQYPFLGPVINSMKTAPRIVTSFVTPPTPNADPWQAYDDNLGEDCSPYGTGRTEVEAVEDLMRKLEDAE